MKYSRLTWNHASSAEPRAILSEYDEAGWERRKVELFADGSVRYASELEAIGGSQLSLIRRPPDSEVDAEPEFAVSDITPLEFETAWNRARSLVGVV